MGLRGKRLVVAKLQRTVGILSDLKLKLASRRAEKKRVVVKRRKGPVHVTRDTAANKPFQVAAAKKLFERFNPDVDTQEIDFESMIDETLHLDENLEILEAAFPMFKWSGPGDVFP